ncbi:MAG: hypothetical protein JOZ24_10785, partial [Candidatus Eremiobacteraeota bacterium]|nr:hypothetical protein [Candidatus Eremiobacteraeota bacterium]
MTARGRSRALALSAALAACLMSAGTAAEPPPLRIALSTEPNSLSPLLALNDYEQFVDRLVFDVLVAADERGNLVPRLAAQVPTLENGGISRDGRTLTYHLRRNVRWHDGVRFTSRDVAFSFGAMMNPANNVANRHGYDLVERVETPDPFTVVFRMKRPYGPAVVTLFSDNTPNAIFPEHLLGKLPDLDRIAFNEQPIGTGPYKLMRWRRGQSVELEANAAYYLGAPKIRRLSIRFVGDEGSILNQLRAHDIDAYVITSLNAFGLGKTIPGIRGVPSDVHGASVVLMNTQAGPTRDPRVRRAIAAAIDKRTIVARFTFGAATQAQADLPPFMWAHDPTVRAQGYDPGLARRLLREAGYDETIYVHGALERLNALYQRHGVDLGPLAPATTAKKADFAGA